MPPKKGKSKKEVLREQSEQFENIKNKQFEGFFDKTDQEQQQLYKQFKIIEPTKTDMMEWLKDLQAAKKTQNLQKLYELFPVAVISQLNISTNKASPELYKFHQTFLSTYMQEMERVQAGKSPQDFFGTLYVGNRQTLERQNIPKEYILQVFPRILQLFSESTVNKIIQPVTSKKVVQNLDDNYQLQFLNEIFRYLTQVKGGISQNQLATLSDGLFNSNDVKDANVLDLQNINEFQKRFTGFLKTNPEIQQKFIQLTPMFQKTIIDRIRKSQQSPDKKQQQEQQLNDAVSQLSQSTLSQQSSIYVEENKSQGSGFSGLLSDYTQSNVNLSASRGQVTEQNRSISTNDQMLFNPSARGSNVSQVNRSLATYEQDAFQELPENIDVLNISVPMSRYDRRDLIGRHLRSLQNSSYSRVVGGNNGMNSGEQFFERLNRDIEHQNRVVAPVNNNLNAFMNNGRIPLDPNPLAHGHDIRDQFQAVAHRLVQQARQLHLDAGYIRNLEQLPNRLMQAQQQANVQAEEAKVQLLQNEEAEQSRFSSNQQLQGAGIANMQPGNIVAQRDQTLSEQDRGLNAIINSTGYRQAMDRIIQMNALTQQQAQLAREAIGPEFILPNLIAASADFNYQAGRDRANLHPNIEGVNVDQPIVNDIIGYLFDEMGAVTDNLNRSAVNENPLRPAGRRGDSSVGSSETSRRLDRRSPTLSADSIDWGSSILVSDNDMTLDFSNLGLDGGGDNPFNRWAAYVNRANNAPQVQGDPAQPRFKMPRVAITGGDLAKYMAQAVKFISEISGPISSVILATYKKQTSVFKGKVEKKETTKFKVKPGAMFRLRCCD